MCDVAAALVTGTYGVGKTTVVEQIADILEHRGVRYGAIDLDWLAWFDPGSPDDDHDAGFPVMLRNVAAVVGNYVDAGVRRLVLAGAILRPQQVAALRRTLDMPMLVVRLTLPIDEVARRLGDAVTAGRQDDLATARAWDAEGRGTGIGDVTIANDGTIDDTALAVLAALGW